MIRNEHVARLAERLHVVRDRGDKLECLCPVPAHGDTRPSLSVAAGRYGGAVVYCHAGCATEDVVAAIGLTLADLMPEPHKVAEYDYRNDAGEVVYTVERWIPKDFRCSPGLPEPARRVLFQMDAIGHARATGETIYVVEGEADAQALWKDHGIPATCNPLGAGPDKWLPHYSDSLAGLHVVVVADNDEPGRAHARAVARSLDGTAAFVALTVPTFGKDVGDLLDAGYAVPDGLAPLAERDALNAIRSDRVQTKRLKWLWPGYLPAGKLSTIDGDPGDGKSTLTIDLAARLTTGRAMPGQPDGTVNEPVNVVMISAEDDPEDTLVPRLRAAGADLARVWLVTAGPSPEVPVNLVRDVLAIEELVKDNDVRWIVIDPLMAFLPSVDAHRDNEVRTVLQPLVIMARRTGVAITTVRHLNKSTTKAMYKGGGSIAFVGAARASYLVGPHPEDETQRALACVKMNVARKPDTLAYRIVTDDDADMPRVVWSDDPVGLGADDIVDGQQGTDVRLARDDARDWLAEWLHWHPSGVKWADIMSEAKHAGHSEMTLRRVRHEVADKRVNPVGRDGVSAIGTYWYPLPTSTNGDAESSATCSRSAENGTSPKHTPEHEHGTSTRTVTNDGADARPTPDMPLPLPEPEPAGPRGTEPSP